MFIRHNIDQIILMFSHLNEPLPFFNKMKSLLTRKEQLLTWFTIMFLIINSSNSFIQLPYLFVIVSIYRIDPKWLTKAHKIHKITFVVYFIFLLLRNIDILIALHTYPNVIFHQILDFLISLGYLVISVRMDYLFGKHIEDLNDPTDQ
eukprot:NODE_583_length_5729_cov_0.479574.p6 type:complete len:148 gc:universal NODE_583_length_5729_cov_0.479574:2622-3065(+)